MPPLDFAKNLFVFIGFDKIIQFLIENGADLNLRDKEGNTPLIVAAKNGTNDEISKSNG